MTGEFLRRKQKVESNRTILNERTIALKQKNTRIVWNISAFLLTFAPLSKRKHLRKGARVVEEARLESV